MPCKLERVVHNSKRLQHGHFLRTVPDKAKFPGSLSYSTTILSFVQLCGGKSVESTFSFLVPGPSERSRMKIYDHTNHLTLTLTISTHQFYPKQHFISCWRAGTKIDCRDQMPPSTVVERPWHMTTWGLGTLGGGSSVTGVHRHWKLESGLGLGWGEGTSLGHQKIQQSGQITFNAILWKQSKLMPPKNPWWATYQNSK